MGEPVSVQSIASKIGFHLNNLIERHYAPDNSFRYSLKSDTPIFPFNCLKCGAPMSGPTRKGHYACLGPDSCDVYRTKIHADGTWFDTISTGVEIHDSNRGTRGVRRS